MKLARSIERWRACDPHLMAQQSEAAMLFAFADAKHDILLLADRVKKLEAELAAGIAP